MSCHSVVSSVQPGLAEAPPLLHGVSAVTGLSSSYLPWPCSMCCEPCMPSKPHPTLDLGSLGRAWPAAALRTPSRENRVLSGVALPPRWSLGTFLVVSHKQEVLKVVLLAPVGRGQECCLTSCNELSNKE